MPNSGPPKIHCSVCHQEVLKSTTLSVGNGQRACRNHEGVESQSASVQELLAKKCEQGRTVRREREKHWNFPSGPSCYICNAEGITEQEFHMRLLVAHKQVELETGSHVMPSDNMNAVLARMGIKEGSSIIRCIAKDVIRPEEWQRIISHITQRDCKIASSIGIVGVCLQCCDKLNLSNPIAEMVGKLSLEDMYMLGASADVTITAIAKEKLNREGFSN